MKRKRLLRFSGYAAALGGVSLIAAGIVDGAGVVDVIAGVGFVICGLGVAIGLGKRKENGKTAPRRPV